MISPLNVRDIHRNWLFWQSGYFLNTCSVSPMNQRFTDMGPKKTIDTTCIRLKTGVGAKLLVTWDKKHDLRYKSGENSTISVEISTSDPHQCCQKHYSVRIFFISAQMSGNLAVLQ